MPVRWLGTSTPRKRIAAITALALGAATVAGFVLALRAEGPTIEVDYGALVFPLLPPGLSGLVIGGVGWLLTLIALLVIAKLRLEPATYAA